MAAFYLLQMANIYESECFAVTILTSLRDESHTTRSLTGSFLPAVTYDTVASVMRQIDRQAHHPQASDYLSSAPATFYHECQHRANFCYDDIHLTEPSGTAAAASSGY